MKKISNIWITFNFYNKNLICNIYSVSLMDIFKLRNSSWLIDYLILQNKSIPLKDTPKIEKTWRGNLGVLIPFDFLIFSVGTCVDGNLEFAPTENSKFDSHLAIFFIILLILLKHSFLSVSIFISLYWGIPI